MRLVLLLFTFFYSLVALAQQTESQEKTAFNGTVVLPGKVTLEMVRVEPGTFTMAHNDGENYSREVEHQVTLTKAYWLGKTEVTQGLWKAVMGDNPSYFKNGDNYPVEQVSWDDIQKFLKKLNEMYAGKLPAGYKFDLPTEAQWEYAAQGGHRRSSYTKYAGSNNLDSVGWYYENSGDRRLDEKSWYVNKLESNHCKTHPVGQKTANELGLYDMSGNVYEWCSDWYGDYNGDATDPCGPATGSYRVLRGGSWSSFARVCRCAYRSYFEPSGRLNFDGFRLALVAIQTEEKHIVRETVEKVVFNGAVSLPGNETLEMVRVEPGTFTMAHNDGYNDSDEKSHQVTLTKAYWLGKTEVTQGQWKAVMGNNPSYFKSGDNYPAEQVSWNDIQEFLEKLNDMYAGKLPAGYKFDLPTEAQWEYAAQGGHKRQEYTKYAGSNNLDSVGWYDKNSNDKTHPVGRKTANELGLYDMSGNVYEWCSDWYGDYNGDATDPGGPATGSSRVLRGGSWGNRARGCRCADRNDLVPSFRDNYLGFRLALVPGQ